MVNMNYLIMDEKLLEDEQSAIALSKQRFTFDGKIYNGFEFIDYLRTTFPDVKEKITGIVPYLKNVLGEIALKSDDVFNLEILFDTYEKYEPAINTLISCFETKY